MARKLTISVPEIGTFSAPSKKGLIDNIEQDRDYWDEIFPDGIPTRLNEHFRLRPHTPEYERLIDAVHMASVDELQEGVSVVGAGIFPPRNSAIGKVIAILGMTEGAYHNFAVANVMTRRLEDAAVYPKNHIVGEYQIDMRAIAESIEAIALVVEEFKSSQTLKDQEALVISLVDQINAHKAVATEKSEKLASFVDEEVSRRLDDTSRYRKVRVALAKHYRKRAKALIDQWDQRFAETHDRYINKLQFEAPVRLWDRESARHAKRSGVALAAFLAALLLMIGFSATVVFWQGDEIAASFHREVCSTSDPTNCRDILDAKGPLTVGAVLLVASLLLWLMKIFNRTYREAGQRAENAAERKSFVETYEAMMQSGQVPEEHRAIVLNAIFRPSKDGQPVDDNNGLDVSAVNVVSRMLHGK